MKPKPLSTEERLAMAQFATQNCGLNYKEDVTRLLSDIQALESRLTAFENLLSNAINFIDPHVAPQANYTNGQMAIHLRDELAKMKGKA